MQLLDREITRRLLKEEWLRRQGEITGFYRRVYRCGFMWCGRWTQRAS